MIHASIPPPASTLSRFGIGEKTWAELWDGLSWRTGILLVLVFLLPGGMLLLPFVIASARKGSLESSEIAKVSGNPTETPLPG